MCKKLNKSYETERTNEDQFFFCVCGCLKNLQWICLYAAFFLSFTNLILFFQRLNQFNQSWHKSLGTGINSLCEQ